MKENQHKTRSEKNTEKKQINENCIDTSNDNGGSTTN